ncbi:MAG: ferredoxin III, nif-specific [Magnetospirillum sp.]|nr:ferredoxin III, nif-specific [Magnetospirillum sp.]
MSTLTRDGRPWQAAFLLAIDAEICIGCGRCFKVCGRGVMTLRGVGEDGALVDLDDDEIERKVMALADAGACIGCGACARVCPTNCQTHGPDAEMAAA